MGDVTTPSRGLGDTLFRDVRCKDCLSEQLTKPVVSDAGLEAQNGDGRFEYSEAWATRVLERGGSRTDRCPRHRREHRRAIQGIAVAYVDLTTLGEVADRSNPTGPLGGLGELPATHRPKPVSVDLSKRQFGMTDDHIREALRKLGNDRTRVLVLRAGTGTGKSTFGPYRLMNPPTGQPGDDSLISLTKLGPIIVTEPRVQATTGVARFVGEKLVANCNWRVCNLHGRFVPAKDADPDYPEGPDHAGDITDECVISDCSDHIGPGYPVGYQVKDDKKHDDSCQLIYVTDGTMVNWLREGRLSKIGTVIVDEAHERSVNIDFILGELKRQLNRHPHLRVLVTSATFDLDFYVDFFGGPTVVESMDVPAVKAFGYGAPFFPSHEPIALPPCVCPPFDPAKGDNQPHKDGDPTDFDSWLNTHWAERMGPVVAERPPEDLHATTRKLETLRYPGPVITDPKQWGREMTDLLASQIVRMIHGLDTMGIYGDILSFLPTEKMITSAVSQIEAAIRPGQAEVYGLIGSMPKEDQAKALTARPPGARRKVVVATNLAETSLTVEGVRFVVDSGIIAQSTWDSVAASGGVRTIPHSQSGVRQRWGRVGRDAPGWVFPLYTAEQFSALPSDTPPGSTRQNLEKLIMTAKAGGVDHIDDFPWPAKHSFGTLDTSAAEARQNFDSELTRASHALELTGIVDGEGHLTTFGKEIQRFAVTGASAATGLAVMFADQLACVPEVLSVLTLLDVPHLYGRDKLFLDDEAWPFALKAEASIRRRGMRLGCTDDLDLALRVSAAWDRSDPEAPPWELTAERRRWCREWWLSETVLTKAGEARHEALAALSPAMKEEVRRFVDPRLAGRARAVLSRAMTGLQYERGSDDRYVSVADPSSAPAALARQAFDVGQPDRILALSRELKKSERGEIVYLKHLVRVFTWACDETLDPFDLLERAATEVAPRQLVGGGTDALLPYMTTWPMGMLFSGTIAADSAQQLRVHTVTEMFEPLLPVEETADDDAGLPEPTSRESNWLLGAPLPDEEELQFRATDTADDPTDPEKGAESNDNESTGLHLRAAAPRDALAAWHESIDDAAVDHPPVVGLESIASDTAMYACIGYATDPAAQVSLVLAAELYAVEVDISPENRGQVRGKDYSLIRAIQAKPDILHCEFDGAGPLQIVASSAAAITEVLARIERAPAQVTGTMRTPTDDDTGRIMGKGGQMVAKLRADSGCTGTTYDSVSAEWQLAAPSEANIRRFIELANQVVSGCTGTVLAAPAAPIRDLIAGRPISDWRREALLGIPVADWPPAAPIDESTGSGDEPDFVTLVEVVPDVAVAPVRTGLSLCRCGTLPIGICTRCQANFCLTHSIVLDNLRVCDQHSAEVEARQEALAHNAAERAWAESMALEYRRRRAMATEPTARIRRLAEALLKSNLRPPASISYQRAIGRSITGRVKMGVGQSAEGWPVGQFRWSTSSGETFVRDTMIAADGRVERVDLSSGSPILTPERAELPRIADSFAAFTRSVGLRSFALNANWAQTQAFAYESQGGRSAELWRAPWSFSQARASSDSRLKDAFTDWRRHKGIASTEQIVGSQLLKVSEYGELSIQRYGDFGQLLEYPVSDLTASSSGKWRLTGGESAGEWYAESDAGFLTTRIESYCGHFFPSEGSAWFSGPEWAGEEAHVATGFYWLLSPEVLATAEWLRARCDQKLWERAVLILETNQRW